MDAHGGLLDTRMRGSFEIPAGAATTAAQLALEVRVTGRGNSYFSSL